MQSIMSTEDKVLTCQKYRMYILNIPGSIRDPLEVHMFTNQYKLFKLLLYYPDTTTYSLSISNLRSLN